MSIGSSTSLLFLLSSCLNSEAVGSSARRDWCRGGKPWLRVWSGNLYRQGVKPPVGKERAKDCWWLCLFLYKQHSVRTHYCPSQLLVCFSMKDFAVQPRLPLSCAILLPQPPRCSDYDYMQCHIDSILTFTPYSVLSVLKHHPEYVVSWHEITFLLPQRKKPKLQSKEKETILNS